MTKLSMFLSVGLTILGACAQDSRAPEDPPTGPRSDRVEKLFDSMRGGTYQGRAAPTLGWEDIPALMARAESKHPLTHFPRSLDSSQFEEVCPEGMVALWLVEGIRRGGGLPSLNALCLGPGPGSSDWTRDSEGNHPAVATAYRTWWSRVQGLSPEAAANIDPLEGSGLSWHGAR